MKLTIKAGHSPVGYKTFFAKLAEESSVPNIVSTHPNPGERAEVASAKIEALDEGVRNRPTNEARFHRMTRNPQN